MLGSFVLFLTSLGIAYYIFLLDLVFPVLVKLNNLLIQAKF